MCGIWISVGLAPPPSTIERVAHRGPDGAGRLELTSPAGPVVLAHRRLAIFDLDARAAQPMTDAAGARTIVFNGAIYNFKELRAELEGLGHRFRTTGDTEVLLAAYAAWGAACLDRLNGMFAFAIYDGARGRILAARDRFGVKPLYCHAGPRGVALASEIKQLLALPEVARKLGHESLHDFLAFGITDHGRTTCFAGVEAVPAGHLVEIDLGRPLPRVTGEMPLSRWYAMPARRDAALGEAGAVDALRGALAGAVGMRLAADVPVGSCLSGGLDSSAIVGTVSRLRGVVPQHVVSAVYPAAPGVDESRYVDAVIGRHPHLVAHRVMPTPERLLAELDDLVWHQEQPFASTSIFAQWCVFAAARNAGLKVMLDGQGADELLGGYHPMIGAQLATMVLGGRPMEAMSAAWALRSVHGLGLLRQAKWLAADLMPRAAVEAAKRWARSHGVPGWLKGEAALRAPIDRAFAAGSGIDALSRRMIGATSLPMLLRFEDRNSMAHGIEARVPFLDYRLVETVLSFGGRFNLRDGETKWLLRRAAEDVLPPEIARRRDKIGFATPEAAWMRGPLAGAARSGIETGLEACRAMLDADRARAECRAMLEGSRPYDGAVWRLWCAGAWARRFGMAA